MQPIQPMGPKSGLGLPICKIRPCQAGLDFENICKPRPNPFSNQAVKLGQRTAHRANPQPKSMPGSILLNRESPFQFSHETMFRLSCRRTKCIGPGQSLQFGGTCQSRDLLQDMQSVNQTNNGPGPVHLCQVFGMDRAELLKNSVWQAGPSSGLGWPTPLEALQKPTALVNRYMCKQQKWLSLFGY